MKSVNADTSRECFLFLSPESDPDSGKHSSSAINSYSKGSMFNNERNLVEKSYSKEARKLGVDFGDATKKTNREFTSLAFGFVQKDFSRRKF